MQVEGKRRVVIENLEPEIDCGQFPIKTAFLLHISSGSIKEGNGF